MTRIEVIRKAIAGEMTWWRAAWVCGVSARHMQRLRERYQEFGIPGLRDLRTGKRQPSRLRVETVAEICRLKREMYPDFSTCHFHQFLVERHKVAISYSWTLNILQAHGLVVRAPGRGQYHRRRERRPQVGMMVHQDASMHEWIPDLPMQDLVIMLDDADGRLLYGRFFEQEGVFSTLHALQHVLHKWGRFCEMYTDRGSHFCRTTDAKEGPDEFQNGQVARVLDALGIRHILARSPEARGRCERAFGTIQRRLPQELRLAGIRTYEEANHYLDRYFIPDFNRRFTVQPLEEGSAFVPVVGIDLKLLVSIQHHRVVRNDNTVLFEKIFLQLPRTRERAHFVRYPVLVHEFLDGTLGVSHQDRLLGTYTRDGVPVSAHGGHAPAVLRRSATVQ